MSRNRDLNFILRSPNLRYLQAGTLAAVLLSIGMGIVVFGSAGSPALWTAAILSDSSEEPTASVSAAPTPSRTPKPLSENPIAGASIGLQRDTVRYYEKQSGRAFSVHVPTVKTTTISDERISGFISAMWLPRVNTSVISVQKPGGIGYRLYNIDDGSFEDLGISLDVSALTNDGKSVAYLERVGDDSFIKLKPLDADESRTLLKTRADEIRLSWADADTLSLVSRRTDRPGSDVSLVAPDGTLRVILSNRENLETSWSPDGSLLLYSYFAPDIGISLWVYVRSSDASLPLSVRTSARKCAWNASGEQVVCGVPPQDSLTRDVPADQTATIDDIVSIDVISGLSETLSRGVQGTLVGVTEPLLTSSGDFFVFTNMFDGRLYMLPL